MKPSTLQLVDELLAAPATDEESFHRFRNYLCWASKGHVFDLLSLLAEYVEVYEGSSVSASPTLIARQAGEIDGQWRQGNLPTDWREAAALQKFIGAGYDQSSRPSSVEQLFNQALWLELHEVARLLLTGEPVDIYTNEGYEPHTTEAFLTPRDLNDIGDAGERLLVKLDRWGAVQRTQMRRQAAGDEEEEPFDRYTLNPQLSYPPAEIGDTTETTQFENTLVDFAEHVSVLADNATQAGVDVSALQEDITQLDDLRGRIQKMKASHRVNVPRTTTRLAIERSGELAEELLTLGIEGAIGTWAASMEAQVSTSIDDVEERTGQPWVESLGEFPGLAERLTSPYFIIGGKSSDNQVLVLNRWDDGAVDMLSAAYQQWLSGEKGRERRRQRLPVVVVALSNESGRVPKIPTEVFEAIDKKGKPFFNRYGSGGRRKAKVKRKAPLAGWSVFVLDPQLGNLDQLIKALEGVAYINAD